jgi:hypothetical protein
MPMKQIAAQLKVSPGSVHAWTRDIEISEEHRLRNLRLARGRFAVRWIEINRQRRLAFQAEAGPARGMEIRYIKPGACCTGPKVGRIAA